MKVICTRCGGMNVACEAIINPNDKSFRNYTDDAFDYGWCDECGYGVVLSDVDEVKERIDRLYADYHAVHGIEPTYAKCEILWKDESFVAPQPVTIKLSTDVDDATDDKIFFYCNGIEELKSLADFDGEEFIITDCRCFTVEP